MYGILLALGAWSVVAAPLAFAAGAVDGYVFNRRWTFGARDSTRARILYVAVQVTGAASTGLLVPLFVAAGVPQAVLLQAQATAYTRQVRTLIGVIPVTGWAI